MNMDRREQVTEYHLVIDDPTFDPEEHEPVPDLPVWDAHELSAVLASFHEWMNYGLSHEQRLRIRWTLTKL